MNILMLYHRVPYPPNKGEKMRAYQQVKHMAKHHNVWLACFVDAEEDYAHLGLLEGLCHKFAAIPLNKRAAFSKGALHALRGKTITEGYYGSRAMWRVLHEWTADFFFDIAFCFSSSMARYVEGLPAGRRILDMNDFDSFKWQDYADKTAWPMSAIFRAEGSRLAIRELELIRNFDLTLMVNDRECARLPDPALTSRIRTFRTPIDVESYEGIREIHRDKVIGFTGTMNYKPNVESVMWFAEHVWPIVREEHADARWWIVGRNPTREVRCLTRDSRITVTGAVDDIRKYLERIRVYVAPVQTAIGIQTKVLEAMGAGRPVVITAQGHEGIKAEAGSDYVVADDAPAFAEGVSQLLSDYDQCLAMARRGMRFIQQSYDATVVMPTFEELVTGQDVTELEVPA